MKNSLFALLAMVCVCPVFADTCDSTRVGFCKAFELINDVDSLKVNHKRLEKSIDSLSDIESVAFEKSRTYYDQAFKDIYCAFTFFLACIGIIIALLVAFLAYLNHKREKKLKTEIKSLRLESNDIKKKLENCEKEVNFFFKSIKHTCITVAKQNLNNNDMKSHFLKLWEYFSIILDNSIELTDKDLKDFEAIQKFVDEQIKNCNNEKEDNFWDYVRKFDRFVKYCKKSSDPKLFNEIENAYGKLYKFLVEYYQNKDRVDAKINGTENDLYENFQMT